MNEKHVAGNTEPRQIMTWLPQEIIERVEKYYAKIHNDSGYGFIHLDIAQDRVVQGICQIVEKEGYQF